MVALEQRDLFQLDVPLSVLAETRLGFPPRKGRPIPTALAGNRSGYRALYERGADIFVEGEDIIAAANGERLTVTDGNIGRAARTLWPHGANVNLSYADADEDVILFHALRHVPRDEGFYIDVGANDPEVISVTKLFYDRGWRGINVEPSPKWFPRLVEARPRDINIQAAVSDVAGSVTFYDHENGGLGTIEKKFADRHQSQLGIETHAITVPTLTLSEIWERHASANVHFLKVDVEGHEAAVLRSLDFRRFRPWLLCIEATEPMNVVAKTFHEWDRLVAQAGYALARSDYLNRYYVARERSDLLQRFSEQPEGYIKM